MRIFRFILLILFPLSLFSLDASPRCTKDVPEAFFRYEAVAKALSIYRVSQSSWVLIADELKRESKGAFARARAIARGKRPDPFYYPYKPKEAEEILLGVLYSDLQSVLARFNIQSEVSAQDIFSFLKKENETLLRDCFGTD